MGTEFTRSLPTVSETRAEKDNDDIFPFSASFFPAVREKIARQTRFQEQRTIFLRERYEIRKKLQKITSRLQKMQSRRSVLLSRLGVRSEEDILFKIQKMKELDAFYEKRREIQKKIDEAINFHCTENAIWETYEKYEPKQLQSRIQVLSQRYEIGAAETDEKRRNLTEIESHLRKLESDDTLPRLKYELILTEQKILAGIRQWRCLAMTHRLVETVKRTYEQKRQPQTLKMASRYLARMTEEKYVRVWTPVDADILLVDHPDGEVFTVRQLSTGTRELLFLALRLALIEGYSRQSISLPVILDDVLVNFDKKRASAAIRVLCEFSRGNRKESGVQLFIFTCHEHIRDIFTEETEGKMEICDMSNG